MTRPMRTRASALAKDGGGWRWSDAAGVQETIDELEPAGDHAHAEFPRPAH